MVASIDGREIVHGSSATILVLHVKTQTASDLRFHRSEAVFRSG